MTPITRLEKTAVRRPSSAVLLDLISRRGARARPENAANDAPKPPRLTLEKGFATAVSRAAQDMFGLAAYATSLRIEQMTLSDLPEVIAERALISVVEGPGEKLGCVILDPGLTAALIEQQTMGRLSMRAPAPRRPTRTDAAMCADYVTGTLGAMTSAIAALPDARWINGYRYSTWLDDPRPVGLMLEEVVYRVIRIGLRLGSGSAREGEMTIALPELREEGGSVENAEAPVAHAVHDFQADLREAVTQAPVTVMGILCRRKVPLGVLRRLAPGDAIPLGNGILEAARLETLSGELVAEARLGELDGRHALRLRRAEAEETAKSSRVDAAHSGAGIDKMAMAAGIAELQAGIAADADATEASAMTMSQIGGGEDQGVRPLDLPGLEPPMEDLSLQDAFRDGESADDEIEPLAVLPMNLSIG